MHPSHIQHDQPSSFSSSPTAAELFARAIKSPSPSSLTITQPAAVARDQMEWLSAISDRHGDHLRQQASRAAEARHDRDLLEWLAGISPRHEHQLRALRQAEADEQQAQRLAAFDSGTSSTSLIEWNEADHPRAPKGTPTGGQWVSKNGGAANLPRATQSDELTVTPAMLRSTGWRDSIHEKLRVAGEIGSAFFAGLGTGAKAVVNGLATAARSAVLLDWNADQLELIGVSKEDRERGYDTAVTIATGSGQVLIAVGTGTMASALAKGGMVARAASGSLVAYDAAGNAVGVVQGVLDAKENGITLANGTQIAGGALGLSANARTAQGLIAPKPVKAVSPPQNRASLGHANTKNYRKTFFDAHPDLEGKVVVHHGVEQQALKKYPGVLNENELHSLENLRGIPKTANSEIHLKKIRAAWDAFYRQHPDGVTKEMLLEKATEIDKQYGHLFHPPIR